MNHGLPQHTAASAILAVFQLFLAGFQWRTYERQRQIMDRQTDIQERQHIATHRPRLIVQGVEKKTFGEDGILISFRVINIGASECTSYASIVKVEMVSKKRGPYLLYPQSTVPPIREDFLGGELFGVCEEQIKTERAPITNKQLTILRMANLRGKQPTQVLVLHGTIYYVDGNKTTYRTSFWREYDLEDECFRATDNTDCEHAY